MAYKNKQDRKLYLIQRFCVVCKEIKAKSEFSPYQHRCIICENKNLRLCCICDQIKNHIEFSTDNSRKEGISCYCKLCSIKRKSNKPYKRKITPTIRMRWLFKGCLRRLKLDKTTDTFHMLGFTKEQFLLKFPEIPKGFDLDHCIPLSWFKDETPINVSCALENLQLLDSSVNYFKRNIFCHKPSDNQYIINSLPFIKEDRLASIKNLL